MSTSREVKIEDLPNGAVLSEDVVDSNGVCLLSAGVTLNQNIQTSLQKRGILSVSIVEENILTIEQRERLKQQWEERLEKRFSHTAGHPVMHELKTLILRFRTRDL